MRQEEGKVEAENEEYEEEDNEDEMQFPLAILINHFVSEGND